jgi:hypothetical protein
MMLLHPAVLSLMWCSAVVGGVALLAAATAVTIAVGWNPEDSSRRQLTRERRSLLVESGLRLVLGWQVVSLFLFVAAADHLHPLFAGAMCAAGTLNASPFGYPTLLVKIAVFVICGLGLVLMRASAAAWTTGLVRFKHLFAVGLAAALIVENVIQFRYFTDLDPEVITSCCATIFRAGAGGVGADLAAVSTGTSRVVFFAGFVLTAGAGARYLVRGRSPVLFAAQVLPLTVVALVAVVSWVAPGFYRLPTHHCPFCLLSWRYGFVGHAIYGALALALVAGCGSWLVHALRAFDRFACIKPGIERRLCAASLAGFAVFSLIAMWPTVTSVVRLEGY